MGLTAKVKPAAIVKLMFALLSIFCTFLLIGQFNPQRLLAQSSPGKTGAKTSSSPLLVFEGAHAHHVYAGWRVFEPLKDSKARILTETKCENICCMGPKPSQSTALLAETLARAKSENKTEFDLYFDGFCRIPGDERLIASATWPSRMNPRHLLYKIDLKSKVMEPIAGGKRLKFLDQEGDRLFLLEQLRDTSFDLTTTWVGNDEAQVNERFRIHVIDPDSNLEPKVFDSKPIHSVLFIDDKSFWVVRDGHLWQLSKDGSNERRLCKTGYVRMAAFSPDKSLLALDLPQGSSNGSSSTESKPKADSRESFTELRVIDTKTGETVFSLPKIDVEISAFSSAFPALVFTWLDNQTIRYSETVITKKDKMLAEGFFQWADIDTKSGARSVYKKYSDSLGIMHQCYVPAAEHESGRMKVGLFDIDYTPSRDYVLNVVGNQVEYGKSLRCAYLTPSTSACQDWRADLRYAGSSEVVNKTLEANLPKGKCRSGVVQISPDGRWAVIQVSNDEQSRLYLVDGKERKTSLLSNLPDTHLNWLQ